MFKKSIISILFLAICVSAIDHFPAFENGYNSYDIGGDAIHFGYFISKNVVFNPSSITNKVVSEINEYKNTLSKNTLKMDSKYRWCEVPMHAILVVWWYNQDTNHGDWFAIRNTPRYWQFLTEQGNSDIISNGKYRYKQWNHYGESFKIYFKNPNNVNGWTPNDIWIGLEFKG